MDEQPIIERLHTLAKGTSHRPKAAIFRDLFPHIEAALQAGISRQTVLEELNINTSLALTFQTFKIYLERTRRLLKSAETRQIERTKPTPQASPPAPFPLPLQAHKQPRSSGPANLSSNQSKSTEIETLPSAIETPTNPYDPSDPRTLDFLRKNPPNLTALEAAGKALRKASKK